MAHTQLAVPRLKRVPVRTAQRPWPATTATSFAVYSTGVDAETMINQASATPTDTRPLAERLPCGQAPTGRQDRPSIGDVLRRAREHRQLTLREVERQTGRANAYLSQIERGLIKKPDPIVLLELAELYGLNFETLAAWARWLPISGERETNRRPRDSTTVLVRQVMELDATERATVLRYVDTILRRRRT